METQICLGIQFLRLTAAAEFKISSQRLKLVKSTMSPKVFFLILRIFKLVPYWHGLGEKLLMFISGTLLY